MTADPRAFAHCPTCGAEYRAGFDVCADDGTPLEPGTAPETFEEPLAAEPAPRPLHETGARWVKLAEYGREEQARLVAGRLELEDIPVTLSPESPADIYGPGSSAYLGKGVELYVPENRLLEARMILEHLERA